MAEADYQALLDRHAREWNAVRGWPTPGESPPPPVLYVLQAAQAAEQLVAGVAGRLRADLRLGPLFVTLPQPLAGPAHPRCTHPTRRTIRAQDTRPAAHVSCWAEPCAARWPWADWPTLGQRIGVDVWDAMRGAAAA